jgi:sugar lactone lactonase YvrE
MVCSSHDNPEEIFEDTSMTTLPLSSTLMLAAAAVSIMGFISPAHAAVSLHVSLVIDADAGTDNRGAVFRIDPSTGERRVLIDFGAREPLAVAPSDVTIDPSGDLLVTDRDAGTRGRGALFRVNPTTGGRRILSDFGDPDLGPQGVDPVNVAINPSSHRIFVLDRAAGTNGRGALFRLVRSTTFGGGFPFFRFVYERRLVSDFGIGEPLGVAPVGLAIDAAGNVVVVDHEAGTDRRGALFRVDPSTGERTVISDFGVGEPRGESPAGLAIVEAGFFEGSRFGSILVIDPNAGTEERGALFRVETTGERTLISDFGVGEPRGVDPQGVAVDGFGNIQVIDTFARPGFEDGGRGALFEVKRNGTRTVISDFNDDTKGPVGLLAQGVGIVPVPLVVDADYPGIVFGPCEFPDSAFAGGALFSVDPFTGDRTLLHDFNDPNQGPQEGFPVLGRSPFAVAIEGPDSVLVIDANAGPRDSSILFRINPSTCNPPSKPCTREELCSGFGINAINLAVEAPGKVLVIERVPGHRRTVLLSRLNLPACSAAVLTDFFDRTQGLPLGRNPFDVAVGGIRGIQVIDPDAGSDERGILFQVFEFHPFTDVTRGVISNFNKGEPRGVDPAGVTIEASQDLLVVDRSAGNRGKGALFRVDPRTGERRLISNFGDRAQGELGEDPIDVIVEASGDILVADEDAGTGKDRCIAGAKGALFRVDPRTGQRRLLSDFGARAQGSLGTTPHGVAVTLTPTKVNLFPVIIP